jgi:hypothetical protein
MLPSSVVSDSRYNSNYLKLQFTVFRILHMSSSTVIYRWTQQNVCKRVGPCTLKLRNLQEFANFHFASVFPSSVALPCGTQWYEGNTEEQSQVPEITILWEEMRKCQQQNTK